MNGKPTSANGFGRRQRGLTLVEIMVALTISLILMGGVLHIFVSSRAAYSVQESLARLQENGRFGLEFLTRELRMAGYRGCSQNITNHLNSADEDYVDALFGGDGLRGWEFLGTAGGDEYTIASLEAGGAEADDWAEPGGAALLAALQARAVPGSDVFIVNRADPLDVVLQSPGGPPGNTILTVSGASGVPGGAIIVAVTGNCSGGDQFQNTSAANANNVTKGAAAGIAPGNQNPAGGFSQHPYGQDAMLLAYRSTAFYVGDANGSGPALYSWRMGAASAAGGTPQRLVEGVENMQVLYGVDTDGDRAVDAYVTADEVADWAGVRSARVALLVRTTEEVSGETTGRTYDLLGTEIEPEADRRLRRVFTTTVTLRNRVR